MKSDRWVNGYTNERYQLQLLCPFVVVRTHPAWIIGTNSAGPGYAPSNGAENARKWMDGLTNGIIAMLLHVPGSFYLFTGC